MRTSIAIGLLCAWLCAAVSAQESSGDLESRWASASVRAGEVWRPTDGCLFYLVQAPAANGAMPSITIDLAGGGRAVVLTPGLDVALVRIAPDRGAVFNFGSLRALRIVVFDHKDQKVFDRPVACPEGRAFLSLRPGWDGGRAQRSLDAQLAIARAIDGDEEASEGLRGLALDPEDHVAALLARELPEGLTTAQAPPPPPPPPPPAPPPPPPAPPAIIVCSEPDIRRLLVEMKKAPFGDDKLAVVNARAARPPAVPVRRPAHSFEQSDSTSARSWFNTR